MILVNMQNFKLLAFLPCRDITSQKCPFQNGTSHRESIFTPRIEQNSKKNRFLSQKTSFLAQIYTPLCISMVLRQNKKFLMFNFSRRLISKTTAATPPPPPPPPPGKSILLKFCHNVMCVIDKNKMSPNLEVLDRAV